MRLLFLLTFTFQTIFLFAQSSATERMAAYERLRAESDNPVAHWPLENIGPTIMSGRVTDLVVNPEQPTEFFVAYASGGLWHTANNGTTFNPHFQQERVMTIGAVAVNWTNRRIYIGSGEVNSSRSSYAGDGIYRSDDGGKSWQHLGLPETHHIGRVIVDQGPGDTIWVAALGHLYTDNEERGVFRSVDGGKNWEKTLYIDDKTGAVDLIRDPRQPAHFYAATWERGRKAWDFNEAGEGSGIWHSTDYGQTWNRISGPESDWPQAETNGRIGLTMAYDETGKAHLYASMDNYARRPAEDDDPYVLTKRELERMPPAEVQNLPTYQLEGFLRNNGFPEELTAELLRERLSGGSLTIQDLIAYLEDANRQLFDTPVIGLEVYELDGKKWGKTHEDYIDGVYNSYGYYFGQLRVNPTDPEELYVMGVPILKSTDGGASWFGVNAANVHADHHALWINPKNPDHLVNGNDGGINISYDGGENWIKCNSPEVGQFYTVAVDNHPDGYRVYGGLQDNGVWRGPHPKYEPGVLWRQEGQYPYERIMGGDGMQVVIDPRDNETVYTGFQFGNYFRINTVAGERTYITPKHELGQRPYRWNWQSPIHMSVHNPDIIYFGSNHLHRSFNQGDDWTAISGDLTTGGKAGDVPFGTLTSIHESPLRFGLLYTGSDDGMAYRSKDGGVSWTPIYGGDKTFAGGQLPQGLWVSRIKASSHEEGRVYMTLNGYRNDDFRALAYRSDDYGDTWQPIGTDLPMEPVNVIAEDPVNPNLLFVGTDHGLYVSMDRGASFHIAGELPRVAVHDLVIQSRANHLLVGTHGRSIYRGDIAQLQTMDNEQDFTVFEPKAIRASRRWGSASWYSDTEPSLNVPVYVPAAGFADFEVHVKDGPLIFYEKIEFKQGLSHFTYDLSYDSIKAGLLQSHLRDQQEEDEKPIVLEAADNGEYYLPTGEYELKFVMGGEQELVKLTIK
ncbi:MAG: glycosyl hydrolase [Bacteroidota bacterium]